MPQLVRQRCPVRREKLSRIGRRPPVSLLLAQLPRVYRPAGILRQSQKLATPRK